MSTTTEQPNREALESMSEKDFSSEVEEFADRSYESLSEDLKIESGKPVEASASMQEDTRLSKEKESESEAAPTVKVKAIDVACGKERMTVRVSFDDIFNGIIYAKVTVL